MAAALGATGLAAGQAAGATLPATPAAAPSVSVPDEAPAADPGLALAARIQHQADHRRTAAEEAARLEAAQEAAAKRAVQAETAARAAADAATTSFVLPTAKYTLGTHYGSAVGHWAQLHSGLDFAAAVGTPVTAVGEGTVTSAGWSGSYGYRVTQTLPDGTEIWYCHLSAIAVTAGQVAPGAQLGRVGATGSATGPHLHLEVRPGGGAPVDPLAWLQQRGVNP